MGLTEFHNTPKRELYRLYWENEYTTKQIGTHYNVGRKTVSERLDEMGIPQTGSLNRRTHVFYHLSKRHLYELYWGEQLRLGEIADRFDTQTRRVRERLKTNDIPRRSGHGCAVFVFGHISKHHLYELYWGDGLSATEIGDQYDVSREVVMRRLVHAGIPTRRGGETTESWVFTMRSRYGLFELHWGRQQTLAEIAAKRGVGRNFVSKQYIQRNIPTYNYGANQFVTNDTGVPLPYQWGETNPVSNDEPKTLPDDPDPSKYMTNTPLYRDKERLYKLYWGYGLSAKHIAAMCDKDPHMHRYLRKQGIPVREYHSHIGWEPHHAVPPKYEWPEGKPPSEVEEDTAEADYQPGMWRDHHTANASD